MTAFGIDARALRTCWTIFLFMALIGFLYLAAHTLLIFALAVFFAHLLGPLAQRIDNWTPPYVSRNAALGILYLLLVGALASMLIPLGGKVGEQASGLASRLPSLIPAAPTIGKPADDPISRIPLPTWLEPQRARVIEVVRDKLGSLDETAAPLLKSIGQGLLSGVGSLLSFILVPILAFFFLKDGFEIRHAVVNSFPGKSQPVVADILASLSDLLTQYIRALVVLSVVVFLVYAGVFSLFGLQYAILLATFASLLEFIPVVGPLAASAIIMLVAAITGYEHLVWVFLFLVIFRLLQDYVLSPQLMSAGVEVHPLLILFGVLAGEQLGGIPGMFFSVPVIASLRVIVDHLARYATPDADAAPQIDAA